MSSKRGIRRRKEKQARERLLLQGNEMTNPKPLMGGIGTRASIAELINARAKFKTREMLARPSVQLVKPEPAPPLEPEPVKSITEPVENNSIIGSDHHKKLIFAEAAHNKEHYLNKQAETGIAWFRNVKKESQYSEFVMLNKEMCEALLKNLWTDGNRKLKVALKEAYKRDIESGHWIPSDEGIGIDYKGVVYNGQHRLNALLESGKEQPFYITFNTLEEAKFTVDSGAKRSESEKIQMIIDTRLGNRTTGFCKALMRGLNPKCRYSETEIVEFAFEWQELIAWMGEHLPISRAEVQAAIAKAYLWYGPEKIEPFCERLREVKFTEEGDPAKALFMVLQKLKNSRINLPLMAYKKTLQAIDCTISNRTLNRILEKNEDIFQWEENWQVPKGAWWHKK